MRSSQNVVICLVLGLFTLFMVPGEASADFPRTLYVLNGTGRTLSKMNLETGAISNDIVQIGQWPNQIVSFHQMLYVLNSGTNDLMIIDPQNDSRIQRTIALPQGSNPYQMAFVGARRVYITGLISNSIFVVNLDSGKVVNEIPVGEGPEGILFVDNLAFVANTGGYPDYSPSSVSIVDALNDSVVKTLAVPMNPQSLALAPDGRIHVLCTGNYMNEFGKVVVIDRWAGPNYTPAVVDTILIGGNPGNLVITPSGKAYCSDYGVDPYGFLFSYFTSNDSVLHNASDPIRVGFGAMQLLYDPREKVLWVANFADDAVQKLDVTTDQVLATYGFGEGAQAMAIVEAIPDSDPWADRVVSFTPGSHWNHFGENFFPYNVLGPPDPDPNISAYNPSTKPEEILSLGHGGEIILQFTNNRVTNGPGPDFTVFENAFISFFTNTVFVEAAIVSVSQDGINWSTFPYDTTTLEGLAGVTPTKNSRHPLDPAVSGGDQFDLSTVDLDWMTYLKLTDLGDVFQEGPYNGDFDLDAVVALHSDPLSSIPETRSSIPQTVEVHPNYPNPFNPSTNLLFILPKPTWVKIQIFNPLGEQIAILADGVYPEGEHVVRWNGTDQDGRKVSAGVYFCRMQAGKSLRGMKMVLLR